MDRRPWFERHPRTAGALRCLLRWPARQIAWNGHKWAAWTAVACGVKYLLGGF